MCGIGGILMFPKDRTANELVYIRQLASNIAQEIQSRGHDAVGFATFNGEKSKILKLDIPARQMVGTEAFRRFAAKNISGKTKNILIHTRAATKGSPKNNLNNHPIESHRYIGIHNGWISNDDELFANEKLARAGQVDSEVIFRLLDKQGEHRTLDAMKTVAEKLNGAFTVATVAKNEQNVMTLIRCDNPVTLVYIPTLNIIAFASLKLHLTNAIIDTNIDINSYINDDIIDSECTFYEPDKTTIWTFDVDTNNPIEQLAQTPVKFTENTRYGNSFLGKCYYGEDDWYYDDDAYYFGSKAATVKDYSTTSKKTEDEDIMVNLKSILDKLTLEEVAMIEQEIEARESCAWSEGWTKGRESLSDELEQARELHFEKGFDTGFESGYKEGKNENLALPEPKSEVA